MDEIKKQIVEKSTGFDIDLGISSGLLSENDIKKWLQNNIAANLGYGSYGTAGTNAFANMLNESNISVWDLLPEDLNKLKKRKSALKVQPSRLSSLTL